MKKLIFGLIAMVGIGTFSYGQEDVKEWKEMMTSYSSNVNKVLEEECPKEMKLEEFKISLIKGENKLSKEAEEKILSYTEPLKKYGLEFAEKNNLEVEDELEPVSNSIFPPSVPIEDGNINQTSSLTLSEVLNCAAIALGADLLFSAGGVNATKWTVKAITKAFRSIATRFLGPVGVGIAVGSFAWCLYEYN